MDFCDPLALGRELQVILKVGLFAFENFKWEEKS